MIPFGVSCLISVFATFLGCLACFLCPISEEGGEGRGSGEREGGEREKRVASAMQKAFFFEDFFF